MRDLMAMAAWMEVTMEVGRTARTVGRTAEGTAVRTQALTGDLRMPGANRRGGSRWHRCRRGAQGIRPRH
ncbi:hypothetical protein MVI01_41840 [Myxococcus virescens]|uniref:Uncharacterized protein n=1 Tax=Myxococcus virescens TaxID=83456 RepID=A0A511HFR8_9BACT|nr:hypothetical protein MVI01_41840 [Myxococcus virescens]